MKYLYFIICITLVSSCGGGGGSSLLKENSSNDDTIITINPVIQSFSSNNYNVAQNEEFTISWTTSMAISCEASGSWSGIKNVSGSQDFIFSSTGNYEFILICIGEDVEQTVEDSISINVSNSAEYSSKCKTPIDDSNDYWLEEFNSPVLDSSIFTYQIGNGFF